MPALLTRMSRRQLVGGLRERRFHRAFVGHVADDGNRRAAGAADRLGGALRVLLAHVDHRHRRAAAANSSAVALPIPVPLP